MTLPLPAELQRYGNPYINKNYQNIGLVFQKYPDIDEKKKVSKDFVPRMASTYGGFFPPVYQQYFCTKKNAFQQLNYHHFEAYTHARFLCGIGHASISEVGMYFHPLFGFPIIPASSIKGSMRHYFKECFPNSLCEKLLFGHNNNENGEWQGILHIADSWIDTQQQKEWLYCDTMTPHYGDYYDGKEINESNEPNIISFLAICQDVKFHFWFKLEILRFSQITLKNLQKTFFVQNKEDIYQEICQIHNKLRDRNAVRNIDEDNFVECITKVAEQIFRNTLRDFALGAKSSSGYGYFKRVNEINNEVEE